MLDAINRTMGAAHTQTRESSIPRNIAKRFHIQIAQPENAKNSRPPTIEATLDVRLAVAILSADTIKAGMMTKSGTDGMSAS